MPRAENARAMVNAGFLYKLSSDNVVQSARIVFGGLSPKFVRATATEQFLVKKKLFTNETLTSALKIMEQELIVEENPPDPSVEYRKKAALGLFYKVKYIFEYVHKANLYLKRTSSVVKILIYMVTMRLSSVEIFIFQISL